MLCSTHVKILWSPTEAPPPCQGTSQSTRPHACWLLTGVRRVPSVPERRRGTAGMGVIACISGDLLTFSFLLSPFRCSSSSPSSPSVNSTHEQTTPTNTNTNTRPVLQGRQTALPRPRQCRQDHPPIHSQIRETRFIQPYNCT